MKTKISNEMLLGVGVVITLGGLLYFLKNKPEESKKSDGAEGLTEPEKKTIEVQETSSVVTGGDFKDKVKTLQTLLGFTGGDVDGDAGSNTKARLKSAGLGDSVTPNNINSLISTLRSRTTAAGLTKARLERARAVTKAASTKKLYTWTDKPGNLPIYVKDALGNYNKTSQVLSVDATKKYKIQIMGQTILSSGFIRARITDNDGQQRFIYVSPYAVTVY
jgi:hypothetical protein